MEADEPALGQVPGDHYPAHRAAGAGDGLDQAYNHHHAPAVARIAQAAGVDRIFVDMEYIGKAQRQGGMDTVQNHHTVEDVARLRPVLDQADACRRETRSFLDRLYGGSLGLMVSTLVGTEALTPDDVEELEELLRKAKEAKRHDESQ